MTPEKLLRAEWIEISIPTPPDYEELFVWIPHSADIHRRTLSCIRTFEPVKTFVIVYDMKGKATQAWEVIDDGSK